MTRALGVGIIGASAETGWARISHVPAVQQLSGVELAAVITTSQASAEKAAAAFGAPKGYGDPDAAFADPAIDIVTVAVKVPDHHQLVLGALRAGKHVYCEWPLSPTLAEAEELADAAREARVKVALGVQARFNPAARAAAKIIAEGGIGRVLSARCFSTSQAWGGEIEAAMTFAEQPAGGMNLVNIQGAHTVDLAISILGDLSQATALAARQYPNPRIRGEDRRVERNTFDHILVQAGLAAGGTFAAEIMGGRPEASTPFRLEIIGEKSQLLLEGGSPRGFQAGDMKLSVDERPRAVDSGELSGLPEAAMNVGGVYAALRDDVISGTSAVPDFDHAVRLSRLVDDLLASSEDGRRREAEGWPRQHTSSNAAEPPTQHA